MFLGLLTVPRHAGPDGGAAGEGRHRVRLRARRGLPRRDGAPPPMRRQPAGSVRKTFREDCHRMVLK